MTTVLRYCLLAAALAILVCAFAVLRMRASASGEVPHVDINSESVAPRPIEDLTSKNVPRDYALAWRTMEEALEQNNPSLLEAYFTGFAKQDLTERVKSQIGSGLYTRYTDRGHKLEAIFYAPAGDAMQLRDRARLEFQILDGDKVIDEETENVDYLVLMTPGADRWLVRQMQLVPEEKR